MQNQQLKWFAFVIIIGVATMLIAAPFVGVLPIAATVLTDVPAGRWLWGFLAVVRLAIWRYRLYDIDLLADQPGRGLYQPDRGPRLGLRRRGAGAWRSASRAHPQLAVAGATLTVAARSSRPAAASNRRLTGASTAASNTAQTIQTFSTRLRDQLDLAHPVGRAATVVDQTMATAPPGFLSPTRLLGHSSPVEACALLPGPTEHHRRPLPSGPSLGVYRQRSPLGIRVAQVLPLASSSRCA